jgi:hypothetical protein
MDPLALLGQEWQTLQHNHEQHEKNALLIKLVCLALTVAGLATGLATPWLGLMVLLCWGQESIFKTYQSRLGERLLRVEAQLSQHNSSAPSAMQLHTEWLAARPSGMGLLASYAASACKPTVAFPYLPLLLTGGLARLLHAV